MNELQHLIRLGRRVGVAAPGGCDPLEGKGIDKLW